MKYAEIVFGMVLVALGLYASISDIKAGIIKNKVLLFFSIAAVLLDVIYYAVFVQDIVCDFLYNVLFIGLISVVLYLSRIWAAGDVKLVLVMTLLIPARFYISINFHITTLFIAICIAFIMGYFYLLSIGCYNIVSGKVKTSWRKVLYGFKQWLFSYIIVILYTIPISVIYVNTGIRIIRVRDNSEVPDYYTSQRMEDDNYSSATGVFKYGKVYWAISPKPNDPKYNHSLKDSRFDYPARDYAEKDMIGIYPIQLQSEDEPDEWAKFVSDMCGISIQYEQSTVLPLPLHLAKNLTEYLFEI